VTKRCWRRGCARVAGGDGGTDSGDMPRRPGLKQAALVEAIRSEAETAAGLAAREADAPLAMFAEYARARSDVAELRE